LYKYIYYKSGELYLENINVQENKKYHILTNNNKISNNDYSEKYVRREYNYDYHLTRGNEEIQTLLNCLNEKIISISDQIEVRYPQYYIAYRTTKNFAEVHVFKTKLTVYVTKAKYKDPKNKLEKVPESYQWAVDQKIDILNNDDLEYAFDIIRTSYEATL
jgi:predicted transport protein